MLVHGIAHLHGHDHEREDEAKSMQAFELELIRQSEALEPDMEQLRTESIHQHHNGDQYSESVFVEWSKIMR
jgi:hypothetical protein